MDMVDQERLRTYGQRFLPWLLVLWLAALVPAARALIRFEWTAGSSGIAPSQLPPRGNSLHLAFNTSSEDHTALLIVAIHPLCSCTRATLQELVNSAALWKQPYHATFLVYKAKPIDGQTGTPSALLDFDWRHSAYIREAQQALNAQVIEDTAGEQAARLGALTSGEVLFYSAADPQGNRRLLFSGGVTAGRGMAEANDGIDALDQAVNSPAATRVQLEKHSPVYGCGFATLSSPSRGGS
jgi:hypothetical protein